LVSYLPILFGSETRGSEADVTLDDEEKAQLRTRIKIEGTIDKAVFEEFKRIFALEIEKAEAEDKVQPSVSHVLEMLLRKGIKTYRMERK